MYTTSSNHSPVCSGVPTEIKIIIYLCTFTKGEGGAWGCSSRSWPTHVAGRTKEALRRRRVPWHKVLYLLHRICVVASCSLALFTVWSISWPRPGESDNEVDSFWMTMQGLAQWTSAHAQDTNLTTIVDYYYSFIHSSICYLWALALPLCKWTSPSLQSSTSDRPA